MIVATPERRFRWDDLMAGLCVFGMIGVSIGVPLILAGWAVLRSAAMRERIVVTRERLRCESSVAEIRSVREFPLSELAELEVYRANVPAWNDNRGILYARSDRASCRVRGSLPLEVLVWLRESIRAAIVAGQQR